MNADEKTAEVVALDGLENIATGQGGRNDSRAQGYRTFTHEPRMKQELLETYRSSWMAAQVVEIPAFEMTRAGRYFDIEDSGQIDKIDAHWQALGIMEKVREAMQWADLFGGGALLMGLEGTGELNEPLVLDRIRPGALKFVHSLDAHTLIPHAGDKTSLVMDPTSPNFMLPEFYQIASASLNHVHHTRIVRFQGVQLPWLEMIRNLWWGGSRVDRIFDAIADAETVIGGVAELITEAKIDVYSIPGLMNMLGTPDGEARVKKRIQLANAIKSNYQAIIKDAGEDYDQKQNAIVQGMGGLIEQYLAIIAAASGIPVTRLLGTSAHGLNATGEGDLRNFYDMIAARQENYLRPRLIEVDEIFLRSALGTKPDAIPWKFESLWQMDESQVAELENKQATTAQIYFNMGVIGEVEIAKQLKSEGTYVAIDDDYIKELESDIEEAEKNAPDPFGPNPGDDPNKPEPEPEPEEDPEADPGPDQTQKRDPAGNLIKPEPEDD